MVLPRTDIGEYQEPGAFGSVLRWSDRLGQGVRALLAGDPEAAARQVGDFVLEPIDAALVGVDAIPTLSRPQDYRETTDLLKGAGLWSDKAGWAPSMAVDVVGGIATDPLTYVSFGGWGAARTGLQAAKKGSSLLRAAKTLKPIVGKLDDLSRAARKSAKAAKRAGDAAEYAKWTERATARKSKLAEMSDLLKRYTEEGTKLSQQASDAPIASLPLGVDIPVTRGQVKDAVGAITGRVRDKIPGRWNDQISEFIGKMRVGASGAIGNLKGGKYLDDLANLGVGRGATVNAAERAAMDKMFADLVAGSDEAKALHRALLAFNDGVLLGKKVEGTGVAKAAAELKGDKAGALAAALEMYPKADQAKLARKFDELNDFAGTMWKNLEESGAITGEGIGEYYPRVYRRLPPDLVEDSVSEVGHMLHRKLKTPDDLAAFLNDEKVEMVDDVVKSFSHRQAQQARYAQRAKIVGEMLGTGENMNDPVIVQAVSTIIDDVAKADKGVAKVLANLTKNNPPRGWLSKVLAVNNKVFKPAATSGILVPRFNFTTRNKLSSMWQALSTADVGGRGAKQAARSIPGDVIGAFNDGINKGFRSVGIGKRRGSYKKTLEAMDRAFQAAGGRADEARRLLQEAGEDTLVAALDRGVLEGFTSSEQLLRGFGEYGPAWWRKVNNALTWPSEVNASMEARMRLGLFMDLVGSGKSADDAAELVGNALLNYGLMKGNATYRTARDVIPFFAFTAQTIPQQADFLRRYPAVAVGLAQLYGSSPNEEPLMPWIADQPSFKVGEDKEGLGQYVTSLGLPVEALGMIPNPSGGLREFGRDVERNVIGSANPLLKTAYGLTTGREPYFGTKYGSYAKTPYIAQAFGAPESSETARLYHQLVGTGLLQMVKTPENMLSRVADPRMNSLEKALSLLTGVRIASNDPDRAAMLMLQEQLQFDPQAKTYTTYYGGSVSTEKMIKLLRKYQDRVKEKREAKEAATVSH